MRLLRRCVIVHYVLYYAHMHVLYYPADAAAAVSRVCVCARSKVKVRLSVHFRGRDGRRRRRHIPDSCAHKCQPVGTERKRQPDSNALL